jgi:hypothetical protein
VIYAISQIYLPAIFGGSKTTGLKEELDEAELIGRTGEEGFKEAVAIHVGSVKAEPLFSPDEKTCPHYLARRQHSSELVFRAIEPESSFSPARLVATFK